MANRTPASKQIPVVILCGGKSERFGGTVPKPLVRLQGVPLIEHVMGVFRAYGFHRFILCTGYYADKIEVHFRGCSPDVRLVNTGENVATGERIRRVVSYLDEEHFFVTYTDGVADIDISNLYSFHCQHGRLATMTVVAHPASKGVVILGSDNRVEAFDENPLMMINGGFFVLRREAIDSICPGSSLERDFLPSLIGSSSLRARKHDGYWRCIDTPKELAQVEAEIAKRGKLPWV